MATRTVKQRDVASSPSSLTLKGYAEGASSAGTAAFTCSDTLSGDVHSWSIVNQTAGKYDIVLFDGSAKVGQINGYVHRDTAETVYLDRCGEVEDTILQKLTTAFGTLITNLTAMITGSGVTAMFTTTAMTNAQSGGSGGVAGPGGTARELTLNLPGGSAPADGASVWISTDSAGVDVIAGTLQTDDFGKVTFMLDAGTYYVWARRAGMNDVLGEEWVVS